MPEDKVEPREVNWRQLMPWTTLFQGFRVALDPNKLVLAAVGILLMAFGWWLLAVVFDYKKPMLEDLQLNDFQGSDEEKAAARWQKFKEERAKWHILHHAAGPVLPPPPPSPQRDDSKDKREEFAYDAGDLADSLPEYDRLKNLAAKAEGVAGDLGPESAVTDAQLRKLLSEANTPEKKAEVTEQIIRLLKDTSAKAEGLRLEPVMTRAEIQQLLSKANTPEKKAEIKAKIIAGKIVPPAGAMRTLPWNEDRGPNPFLLVTAQAGTQWEPGHFMDWLLTKQIPVLVEPLVKLFSPVVYFFNPRAGSLVRFYCLLVMLWTVLVWGFFGGAITRIAVVQVARQEKVGLTEAVRFAGRKYLSYLSAPLFPLALVAILLILMVLFGFVHMIPLVGDLVDILLWGLIVLIALAMGVVLIGLVGWPLMSATISAEGTDAWEAVSRAFSYVYQAPWHYLWYSLVALTYGAVVVFFVGLMGSLTVYLSKWGVSQTPGINWRHESYKDRNPTYLFVYAPTSFEWRKLLLQDDSLHLINSEGQIDETEYKKYLDSFSWYNYPAAVVVSVFWVGAIFMLVLGFGYSYFWTATTIMYLLMRRKVDDAELDEVYLEEEDEAAYAGPLAPKPTAPAAAEPVPAPTGGRPSLPIVEAPPRPTAVMVPPPPAEAPVAPAREEIAGAIHTAPPPEPPPPQPPGTDGNPSPEV